MAQIIDPKAAQSGFDSGVIIPFFAAQLPVERVKERGAVHGKAELFRLLCADIRNQFNMGGIDIS